MYIRMDTEGLERFARDMRRAGRTDLNKELLKVMRRRVKPLVPELRSAIRASPSTGKPRTTKAVEKRPRGLRDCEARGVQVKASLSARFAGVTLRIDNRHFPPGQKALPKYREGAKSPWRSPNWGRSSDWKSQRAVPVFYPTIRAREPAISAELIGDISEFIDRATREGAL